MKALVYYNNKQLYFDETNNQLILLQGNKTKVRDYEWSELDEQYYRLTLGTDEEQDKALNSGMFEYYNDLMNEISEYWRD